MTEKLTGNCELIEVESILITWLKSILLKTFPYFCHKTLKEEKHFHVSAAQESMINWGDECDACEFHMAEERDINE